MRSQPSDALDSGAERSLPAEATPAVLSLISVCLFSVRRTVRGASLNGRILAAVALLVGSCGPLYKPDRPPEKLLLPDGFVGWTRLDYGVDGASPLLRDGEYVVVRYPASGHLVTSSVLTGTYGLSTVYYYSGDLVVPAQPGFRATGGFTRWNEKDPQDKITWFAYFGTDADAAAEASAADARDAVSDPAMGQVIASRRLATQRQP